LDGVDWPRSFALAHLYCGVERYLEADPKRVVRRGVHKNRLAGKRFALLAFLQLASLALYLIPPTAVLGAVLLTGYLGGAIATYVRMGEPYPVLVPLSTSLIAWAGIYLREERLRALLPVRRNK
jgi:hypothetical protein